LYRLFTLETATLDLPPLERDDCLPTGTPPCGDDDEEEEEAAEEEETEEEEIVSGIVIDVVEFRRNRRPSNLNRLFNTPIFPDLLLPPPPRAP